MKRTDYTSLEEAAEKWSKLQEQKLKILGINPVFYFGFFLASFIVYFIFEDDVLASMFVNIFWFAISIAIGYLVYTCFPYFVSRRERYGKSQYQFFTKRMSYTVCIPLFIFFFAVSQNKGGEVRTEGAHDLVSVNESISEEPPIRNDVTANIVKEHFSQDERPVVSAPISTSKDTVMELMKLPESSPELFDSISAVHFIANEKVSDTPETTSNPPKKKWRLFRKRKNEE